MKRKAKRTPGPRETAFKNAGTNIGAILAMIEKHADRIAPPEAQAIPLQNDDDARKLRSLAAEIRGAIEANDAQLAALRAFDLAQHWDMQISIRGLAQKHFKEIASRRKGAAAVNEKRRTESAKKAQEIRDHNQQLINRGYAKQASRMQTLEKKSGRKRTFINKSLNSGSRR